MSQLSEDEAKPKQPHFVFSPTGSGKTRSLELMMWYNAYVKAIAFGAIYCTSTKVLRKDMAKRLNELYADNEQHVGYCFGRMSMPDERLRNYMTATTCFTYEKLLAFLKYGTGSEGSFYDVRITMNDKTVFFIDEFQNVRDPTRGPVIEYIIQYARMHKCLVVCLSGSIYPEEVEALKSIFGLEANIQYITETARVSVYNRVDNTVMLRSLVSNFVHIWNLGETKIQDTMLFFCMTKKECYIWAKMLWNAAKLALGGYRFKSRLDINPETPYSVSFDCQNANNIKHDIAAMAKHRICVYWSDTKPKYNEFFSDKFKTGANKQIILFTTSVMAEGIDYPNVKTVFVSARII
jgi:hypothetical protein